MAAGIGSRGKVPVEPESLTSRRRRRRQSEQVARWDSRPCRRSGGRARSRYSVSPSRVCLQAGCSVIAVDPPGFEYAGTGPSLLPVPAPCGNAPLRQNVGAGKPRTIPSRPIHRRTSEVRTIRRPTSPPRRAGRSPGRSRRACRRRGRDTLGLAVAVPDGLARRSRSPRRLPSSPALGLSRAAFREAS